MEPEELTEELLEELGSKNVVLEAYPGWGKTRLASSIAANANSVVVVTRTHEEIYEIMRFSNSLTPLFGKEKLCLIWKKGEDTSVYTFCRRMRILGLCPYKYRASHELVRWIAGRKPSRPEEIVERSKKKGVCPYPSILALAIAKSKKVVTTYGFAFTFKQVLDKDIVIYDESHEILNVLTGLVEKIDEAYIQSLVTLLKKNAKTRGLAYFIRTCWRKSATFRDFVRLLERAPAENEFIDNLVTKFYSNKVYWRGKEGYVLLSKPDIRSTGCLFLTAYLPPFFVKLIPNPKVIRVPPDVSINVVIDTDATSRYEERTEDTYRLYAKKIEDYYTANAGNLVVFPSYDFMEKVKQYLPDYILERIIPPEAIRELGEGDIVFDVAGGKATEGVNPSPTLNRVIVIGLPYPPPSGELNLLSKLYGFDAVYTYLGLLKVVQTVGRLRFRENTDAILIDRRYMQVKEYFPPYFNVSTANV